MKKVLLILTVTGVIAAGLVIAAPTAAEEFTPPGPRGGWGAGEGPLHEVMLSSMADALGLNVGELEARLEAGESMVQIALDQGYDPEEAQELMLQARTAAVEQAIAEGLISEEMAEYMQGGLSRFGAMDGPKGPRGDIAETLGLGVEELHARLQAGETIPQIAEELGVELPQVGAGAHFGPQRGAGSGLRPDRPYGPCQFSAQDGSN